MAMIVQRIPVYSSPSFLILTSHTTMIHLSKLNNTASTMSLAKLQTYFYFTIFFTDVLSQFQIQIRILLSHNHHVLGSVIVDKPSFIFHEMVIDLTKEIYLDSKLGTPNF